MASEDTGLINRVIKFHLAQRMWSQSTNVKDGRTDRRTEFPQLIICALGSTCR